MIDDLPLREVAARQRGLVTVSQAAGLGFDKATRHRLVDGRRWRRRAPRVLELVGSVACDEQDALAAILDAGAGAALAGSSALAWWGVSGNQLRPFHVVRWRDRSTTTGPGDRRHEPVLLPAHHVVELDGIPVEVPARALFDVAGSRRRGVERPWFVAKVERMVDNAWSDRLVSGRTLHAMLDEMAQRGRPGIRVMRQVLATRGLDYVPPASNLEARAAKIVADAGLPPLRRQVNSGDQRTWIGRVDLRAPDVPLIVEVQSERFHSSLIDRQLDADRIARLQHAGFVVVEVTDAQVWHRPQEVVQAVRQGRDAAARRASTAA